MIKNINIIKSKFKRIKKNILKTDLYENLDKDLQYKINNNILFLENETPILSYFASEDNYWLLTDIRIITDNFIISLDEIEIVNIPEIFDEGRGNSECDSLEIVKKDTHIFILRLEKLTWHIIFNILTYVIRH
ncbi:hypothetical protein [Chryseobacterium sp. JUb7]|uniref:hypothetical protein n=1 Tax=Chryseobacterium sp. JUb7 TaxID=2940599 RepID=UPI002168ECB4|nr:hypothetical protein [Chryseobacterium sp. JUb7]MCS3533025.1 hypothetical protein [Chryseobacterium sp. JUb7]